ncbi:L,D-transpeptidase [Pseudoroseomonas globiformis]|uniref:L,D-transpeptidase n=1 Tax=Teichococcus globiformis TaxID=2307229 RepID=A0ABV7G113_9PROT
MIATVLSDGRLRLQGRTWRCALGRGGVSPHKEEGDGATPLGLLPLRRVLYRADRGAAPACAVPVEPIAPNDGWCDDPASPAYNTMIRLPHEARHEELWRGDHVYDVIGVLGWNDRPVVRGRGSAIFLHLARPDYPPTEGCIALDGRELRDVLAMGVTGFEVVAA